MLRDYYPLKERYYHQEIDDDFYTAKWGRVVELIDLNQATESQDRLGFVLLGFKCDKGVYINNGRVGAVEAPMSIRQQLAKLPWHLGADVKLYDAGNIDGPNRSLEELQRSLAQAVKRIRELGYFPLVLGGGHETAYGHYQGLVQSLDEAKDLAVINFDAHFDLRPYDYTGPNSGTGFRQIYDSCQEKGRVFPYLVLGIQEHHNQLELFQFASQSEHISFLTGQDLYRLDRSEINRLLDSFLAPYDEVYITIDMDCFAAGAAPGVSAVQSFGIDPNLAVALLQHLTASGKLIGLDVVEVSPPHDIDGHTAQLAASLIFYVTQILAQQLP